MNAADLTCPPYFSPFLRGIWGEIVPYLIENAGMGLSADLDRHIVEMYICELGSLRKNQAAIIPEGEVLTSHRGTMYLNPRVKLINDKVRSVTQLGTRLGLNPRARQVMGVHGGTVASESYDDL
jgi:P27 family predicted phage terminase small subunit